MSLPMLITSWLFAWPAIAQEPKMPMEATEMRDTATGKQMTADQQVILMRFTEIGLQWVAGNMPFDKIVQRLGKPARQSDQSDIVEYSYYPDEVMAVYFTFAKLHPAGEKTRISTFTIKVEDGVHTDIPYEHFDQIGLHRVVPGETIDGVLREASDFFSPSGRMDITRTMPDNYVMFTYRLALPSDSPFFVYVLPGYLGEWVNSSGEPTFNNLRRAVDLRNLTISRDYLTPEGFRQRQQAKRQKYGEMNLCTGMICPETGLWEGWSQNGPTGQFYLEAGRRFPDVRTIPAQVHWYCEHVPGRWMWLKEDDRYKVSG
ncbi:hypothetical protein WI42_23405 [Burkholderia ubonensis]|nr:hypothetical protein WI42_23405 [Burkholderia ubonensis]KVA24183.1 hypothetical protein WI43_11030 [Burkholderia ubonensis]KVA45424.1 hypothetical protein WI46_06595 [Burkholderia ubonensis]